MKFIHNLFKQKERTSILLIFIATLVIVAIWFSDGIQIAGGEESFSIFNGRNIASLNGNWEEIGTGFSNPTNLGRIPISLFVGLLTKLGFKMWLIQAIFFYVLVFTGITAFYLLLKEILDLKRYKSNTVILIGSFFYFLNLYSLSQIWARFLYSHMATWSLTPLLFYLWIRLLKTQKISFMFLFNGASFIFTIAFMQPAFIILIWSLLFLWSGNVVLGFRKAYDRTKIILFSALGFLSWSLINFWWLLPTVVLSKVAFADRLNTQSSIDSLRGVSQYFPSEQIFILKQSFGFGELSPWYNFYSQNYILSLSVVIFLITCFGIGLYSGKNKLFLMVLLFTGWFISKGTNPPFGNEFFTLLFEKIPFFGVLRNSYEKFGLMFLIPYSIFFTVGIMMLTDRLGNKKKISIYIVVILVLILLNKPLWTGEVFKLNKIQIPIRYEKMNSYLNSHGSKDGRLLVTPLLPGDGIDYSWGYSGVEPSEYLFDMQSISKILRQPYFDEIYMDLITGVINNKNVDSRLDALNIEYILVNDDVLGIRRNASSSAEVIKFLGKNKNIRLATTIDSLHLYHYSGNRNDKLIIAEGDLIPEVAYKKIGTEEYEVDINNSKKPFNLILKNSYNPLWIASIDGRMLDSHYVAYSYANGWKIEKTGNFRIKISFKVYPWD